MYNFQIMNTKIFTDGAARGNPGPGGWAGIVLHDKQVTEIGGNEKHTTNNRMELTAAIKSLEFVSKLTVKTSQPKALLYTDSAYVLNGATKWLYNWKQNGWKTATKKAVENVDLWQELDLLLYQVDTEWKLLPGHSGLTANERCDEIATTYADGKKPKLYSGILKNYGIDLEITAENLKEANKKHDSRSKKKSSGPGYSYVSMVKGVIKVHKTWAECEKRVKGVSNTRFKKAVSPLDEKNIIEQWKKSLS
jgi:ribonuclease HI